MALSSDLISQFVKLTNDGRKPQKETTVYGTVVIQGDSIYVKLDGSDQLTPVSTTATVRDGERVTVMMKNHTATITGNISSPSARNGDVEVISNQVNEFGTTISKVTEKVNEIGSKEVGGRNYVLNSSFDGLQNGTYYTFDGEVVTFTDSDSTEEGSMFTLSVDADALENFKNKEVVISVDYKVNTAIVYGDTEPQIGLRLNLYHTDETSIDYHLYGDETFPTEVCDWTRISCVHTISDTEDWYKITLSIYGRDFTGSVSFRHPKVEIGNTATDWTPNPSDISSAVGSSTNLAGSDYEGSNLFETIVKVIERTSSLEQTSGQFSFDFEEVRQTIDDLGNLSDEYNTKLSFVRITNEPAILLGSSDSTFTVKITNDRISFMDNDVEVAYVAGQRLEISNANIHDNLWFGDFRWFKRENGNMALKWEGS